MEKIIIIRITQEYMYQTSCSNYLTKRFSGYCVNLNDTIKAW